MTATASKFVPVDLVTGSSRAEVARGGGALLLSVIDSAEALDALSAEWEALFDSSPAGAAPLRFTWVQQWWKHYGPVYGDGGRGLRVVTFRRAGRLVGVAPLYLQLAGGPLRLRRLRFISTGAAEFEETSCEYLGLLHAPGEADACVQRLAATLLEPPPLLEWDELRLDDMAADATLLQLEPLLQPAGRVGVHAPGVAYVSNLAGGLEAYLLRLSPGTRKKGRKFLRDLQTPALRFEIATTAEQAATFFDQLVELHHQRWRREGKAGSFSPRHAAFHRAVAVALTGGGVGLLARVTENGVPIALTYGYRVGSRFECYQMGVTREPTAVRSPGAAVFLGLASHLAGQGVTVYDHLMGANRFKTDYAKDERDIRSLRVERDTWRMAVARGARSAVSGGKHAARGVVKVLRTRLCGTPAPAASVAPPQVEEEA